MVFRSLKLWTVSACYFVATLNAQIHAATLNVFATGVSSAAVADNNFDNVGNFVGFLGSSLPPAGFNNMANRIAVHAFRLPHLNGKQPVNARLRTYLNANSAVSYNLDLVGVRKHASSATIHVADYQNSIAALETSLIYNNLATPNSPANDNPLPDVANGALLSYLRTNYVDNGYVFLGLVPDSLTNASPLVGQYQVRSAEPFTTFRPMELELTFDVVLSDLPQARKKVPGEPEYGDILMRTLRRRPINANDPHNTFDAMDKFRVTHLYWSYVEENVGFVEDVVFGGRVFGGAVTGLGMEDSPGGDTQVVGRDKSLSGSVIVSKNGDIYGDLASDEYREIILSYMKVIVDGGGRSVQIDDPISTWAVIRNGGPGGYGDAAMTRFARHLQDNGFSGKHGLPTNLAEFDYRAWVVNVQGGRDRTSVRSEFERFHEQVLMEFYSLLKDDINAYALSNYNVPNISFSVNYTPTINQTSPPPYEHPDFDFWLGETNEKNQGAISSGPGYIYRQVKYAESLGRFQMFDGPNDSLATFPTRSAFLSATRNIFAAAYASGSQMLVPWDKYRTDGSPRFFATLAEFGDLTGLISENRHLYDDHEEVFAVGGEMTPKRAGGVSIDAARLVGAPADTLLTVRAIPGVATAPLVVHLVDYRNISQSNPPSFSVDLHNELFGWSDDTPIFARLLIPGEGEQTLEGTLLVGGYTRFDLPFLDPYALLVVMHSIPGDYNRDGTVDAADYTVWRNSLGIAVGLGAGADGDGDGMVTERDYRLWRSNYGLSISLVGTASHAVGIPEPSTLLMLMMALSGAKSTRRMVSSRQPKTIFWAGSILFGQVFIL